MWGHVLTKYRQTRVIPYPDDFVSQSVTQQTLFGVTHRIINDNSVLTPLNEDVSLSSLFLKVSLVLVCLLVLMLLYGILYLKRVGLS